MRILITGATGMVGRRLVLDRLERGDRLVVLSRRASRAATLFASAANPNVEIVGGNPAVPGPWQDAVAGCDAIVHLAGAGVGDRRWTAAYKREIVDSRVDSTFQVVEAMRRVAAPPRVLITASAIGWYGDTGDRETDETAPAVNDFLGDLAVRWEAEATKAESLGARVARLRLGLVLDERGGLIKRMTTPFRLFVGGPLGNGRQYMSWIHWRDVIGLVDLILRSPDASGPINATAPAPVTNRVFSRALAAALGRPSWLPVPAPALRVVMGELAQFAMMSQRVVPRRALQLGYQFAHPEIQGAMDAMFDASPDETDHARATVRDPAVPPAAREAAASSAVSSSVSGTQTWPSPPATIKLIAVGVDGTLLRSDGRLPQGAVHALRAAQRAECAVVLATARPPRAMRALLGALELIGPLIAYNGAAIWNPLEERAQYHEALAPELARAVVDVARDAIPDIHIGVEVLDHWFTDRLDPSLMSRSGAALEPDDIGPIDGYLSRPVTQIDLFGAPAQIAEVRKALAAELWREQRIAVFQPDPALLQVAHPLADKSIALQRMAHRLGVDRDAVMAIGDGPNDTGMIDWVGFGVAVDNAVAATKAVANVVVESNDEHGVARAVQRFVLSRR